MIRAGTLSLAALCCCAIDDRSVELARACGGPPPGGALSDFSTARLGRCLEPTCPEALVSSSTVSLGVAAVRGLVFLYDRPDTVVLELGLTGDLGSVRDPATALRVVMSYDSLGRAVPPRVGGFAVQFVDCVDTTGYAGLRFHTEGDLGTCPLSFAPRVLNGGGRDTTARPCPLDDCSAASRIAVTPGITDVALTANVQATPALSGMQWELGLPGDGARTCSADFTIDDLRLVPPP